MVIINLIFSFFLVVSSIYAATDVHKPAPDIHPMNGHHMNGGETGSKKALVVVPKVEATPELEAKKKAIEAAIEMQEGNLKALQEDIDAAAKKGKKISDSTVMRQTHALADLQALQKAFASNPNIDVDHFISEIQSAANSYMQHFD